MQAVINAPHSIRLGIAGQLDYAPEAAQTSYLPAHSTAGSAYDISAMSSIGLQHFHTGFMNTFDLRPMNRQVVMGLGCMATAAAAVAAPITGAAPPGMWLETYELPSTAVAWDNPLQRLQHHPAIASPHVQSFLRAAPQADVGAIRDMYDLTEEFFGDVKGLQRDYCFHRDHDTGEAVLFLTLRTQGQLELDQLLGREIDLFTAADTKPALKAVQAYHVVTAV